ncbi:MAG: COX15/CtaA family protein [Pseudomonadota bacterium]
MKFNIDNITLSQKIKSRILTYWLLVCLLLITAMMVINGFSRIKESQLSILQWKNFSDVTYDIFPNEKLIEQEFESYESIPQFKKAFPYMELEEFKTIYKLEYASNSLESIIKILLFTPLIIFTALRFLGIRQIITLLVVINICLLSEYSKSYMLQNGLFDNKAFTPYRISLQLILQYSFFCVVLWNILSFSYPKTDINIGTFELSRPHWWIKIFACILLLLILVQITLGGAISGLDGGVKFNSFPKMDGEWIPEGMFELSPWYKNIFEDVTVAQFVHRILAYLLTFFILIFWLFGRNNPHVAHLLPIVFSVFVVEFMLGVLTVLFASPVRIASLHQANSILFFAISTIIVHRLFRPIKSISY